MTSSKPEDRDGTVAFDPEAVLMVEFAGHTQDELDRIFGEACVVFHPGEPLFRGRGYQDPREGGLTHRGDQEGDLQDEQPPPTGRPNWGWQINFRLHVGLNLS